MKNENLKAVIKELGEEFKRKMSSYPIDLLERLMKADVHLDGSTVLTTNYAMALFRGKTDKDKDIFEDCYIPLKVIVKYDGVIEYILDYNYTMDDNEHHKVLKEAVRRLRTYSEYLEMMDELRSIAANDMKIGCTFRHIAKGIPIIGKITEECDTTSVNPMEWKLKFASYVVYDKIKGEIRFGESDCRFSSLFGYYVAIDGSEFNEIISDRVRTIVSRIEKQEKILLKEKQKYNAMLKDAMAN